MLVKVELHCAAITVAPQTGAIHDQIDIYISRAAHHCNLSTTETFSVGDASEITRGCASLHRQIRNVQAIVIFVIFVRMWLALSTEIQCREAIHLSDYAVASLEYLEKQRVSYLVHKRQRLPFPLKILVRLFGTTKLTRQPTRVPTQANACK